MNNTANNIIPNSISLPTYALRARYIFLSIISLFVFGFFGGVQAQSITVTSVSPNPVCAGSTVTVNFNTTINGSKDYVAILSQSNGTFPGIATDSILKVNQGTHVISLTVPTTATTGSLYVIHVTETGGTTSNNFSITVNARPTITGTLGACVGGSTTLTGSGTSGTWSSSNTAIATVSSSGVVTGVAAGTSTITYTDNNGCSNTATFTVSNYPTLTSPSPAAICSNTTFSYTPTSSAGGTTTFNWTRAAVAGISNAAASGTGNPNETLFNTTPSTVNVTYVYTLTANGCTNPTTYNVVVPVKPLPTASINQSGTYCCNSSPLQLTVTGQTCGTWSASPTTPTALNITPGTAQPTCNPGGLITFSCTNLGNYTVTYSFNDGSGAGACTNTTTTNIVVTASASSTTINGNTPLCTGQTSTLTSSPSGGNWASSNTSVATINNSGVVTALSAGSTTITYTVTTANGCTATGTTTVTVTAPPTVSITGSPSICVGSTTTLTSNGATGTWGSNNPSVATVNASTGVVTAVAAGSATFTFTSSTAPNCNATTSAVTVNALPTITTQPFSLADCKGNSVAFSASYSASGNITYQWQTSPDGTTWTNIGAFPNVTGASGTSSSSPLQLTIANVGVGGSNGANTNGTRYRVIITDANGCSVTTNGSAILTVNSISGITGSPSTPLCEGQSISYTVTTSGNIPVSYQWVKHDVAANAWNNVSGATSSTITFSSVTLADAGEYAIKVTFPSTTNTGAATTCIETNNYGITRTIVVNAAATVTAGGPDNICQSATPAALTLSGASVGGGATTGAWSIISGGGTLSSTAQTNNPAAVTYTPAANSTGTVTLRLTSNATAPCTAVFADRTINVNALPATPTITAGTTTFCAGGSVTLTSSSATGNQWNLNGSAIPGATSQTYPATATGSYTITVTNANNCSATSAATAVTVNPVIANNIIAAPQTICSGSIPAALTGSTPTGGNGSYTYLWQSSTDNVTFTTAAGTSNGINYTPGALTQTTYFKRTVTSGGCTDVSAVIQITVNGVITNNTVSAAQSICTGTAPNPLTGSTTGGGDGSYTYLWESSTTSPVAGFAAASGTNNTINYTPGTLTQTTWYRRTTTSGGCTNTSAAIQITVNSIPTATIAGTTTVCQSAVSPNITFTGANGTAPYTFTYQINGGGNQNITTVAGSSVTVPVATATTGNYVYTLVSVSDANSCSQSQTGTATVVVSTPVTITLQPHDSLICSGNSVAFVAAATGNPAPTVQWQVSTNGGGSWSDIAGATNAMYTFIPPNNTDKNLYRAVFSNGCTATTNSAQLLINSAQGNILRDVVSQSVCNGGSVMFYAEANGGQPISAQWQYSPDNGVTWVNIPGATQTSTTGLSTGVTSSTYIFTPTGSENGYIYRVDFKNACGDRYSNVGGTPAVLTVNPLPTVSQPSNVTACNNTTVNAITFSGTNATYYNWTNNNTNIGLAASGSGNNIPSFTATNNTAAPITATITVTAVNVTNGNICPNNSDSKTFTITVNPSPAATITPGGATTFCAGGSVVLTSSAGSSYLWSPGGATSQSITVSTNGSYTVTVTNANNCSATSVPAVVTVNPLPTATIAGTTTVCQNAASPTITFTGATGTAPYTFSYNINGGATQTTSSNIAAPTGTTGVFTYNLLSVTDSKGCTQTQTGNAVVTVNAATVITTQPQDVTVCAAGNATFTVAATGTGTLGYQWQEATGGNNFNNLPGQTSSTLTLTGVTTGMNGNKYHVIVTGGCGTVTSADVTLTVNANPTVTVNSPTVCANSLPATITATPNPAGTYTYVWTYPGGASNPGNVASFTISTAGAYSVTITNANGCVGNGSGTLSITPNPTAPTAGSNTPICAGSTLNLTASAVAGATYAWTGPNGFTSALQNPSITNATTAATGTYNVTVTVNGCISVAGTTSVVVNAIPTTPTAGSNTPICAGSTLNLTASAVAGATYAWTGPNGFTSTSQNPSIANATTAATGTYNVTVTLNGCTSVAGTTSVTVNAIPAAPTASNNGPVCAGSTLNLTTPTVAGATYAWTGPNSFSSISQNPSIANATTAASGTYSVTITVNGCTSAAGTTTATVNAIPTTPTAANSGPVCAGSTLNLTTPTVAGATYAWTGPNSFSSTSQNPSIANATTAASGTYNVTVTVIGCTSTMGSTTATVNAIPAAPTAANNGPVCVGSTLNLTTPTVAGATYSWSGPNSFSSTSQNPSIANATTAASGTYNVTVTVNGCTSAVGSITATVNAIPTTPTATNSGPVCVGSTLNLTTPAVTGATYAWTGPNSFSSTLQNPSITNATTAASGTYNVTVTVNGCTSAAGSTTATVNAIPVAPTPIDGFTCGTGTVVLNASGCSGTLTWYTTSLGGSSVGTGSPFTTPTLSATTSYYVSCTTNGCEGPRAQVIATVRPVDPGSVGTDQIICNNGDPALLTSVQDGSGAGGVSITYQWESSTNGGTTWTSIPGATATTYNPPPPVTQTTWYRRVTTGTKNGSGGFTCSVATNVVIVTVNSVSAGTVGSDQAVCTGGDPAAFTITAAATGSGTLTYQWQSNTTGCSGPWTNISGATSSTYDVPAGITIKTYYQLIVTSTLNGVACTANSNCITITVNPKPAPVITHN